MSGIPSLVYFYSSAFLIFFAIVWSVYWALPQQRRNIWILAASYFFYASWDIRFFPLLMVSTLVNYWGALKMAEHPEKKKFYFSLCLLSDLGFLISFKYAAALIPSWGLILPLGISFYTFQTLSYSIDVFKGRIKPEKNFINFAVFVSFFPQLIAGPIERAVDFVPQVPVRKILKQIPWNIVLYLFIFGMFKKRVLGDYFAVLSREAFDMQSSHGFSVILGFFAYGLQAYCDISGYTDMARGLALSLGFKLNRNFNFPFFSRNPSEFWERWHISLTQWIKHYVYVPLLVKLRRGVLPIIIAFLAVSLWYGPHLNYLVWGFYWSSVVLFYHFVLKPLDLPGWANKYLGTFTTALAIFFGFSLFRAESFEAWLGTLKRAATSVHLSQLLDPSYGKFYFLALLLMIYDWFLFRQDDELYIARKGFYLQASFYILLFFIYRNVGTIAALDFIYFKY